VFADDRLIDRIAERAWGSAERTSSAPGALRRGDAGQPALSQLATADPLTELFETWRDELAADPMPALPILRPTLVPQRAAEPPQRRTLRPALAIAAAIAALLVGTATIGSKNAEEGTALWGITQVMWPDRVVSVASAKTVETQLELAKTALQAGRSRDAQDALIAATLELAKIDPVDGHDDIKQRVDALWATAADQVAVATQDGASASTSTAPSSPDLTTSSGTTALSTVAPAPLVLVPTTETPAAELAGGVIVTPGQPQSQSPNPPPVFDPPPAIVVDPSDPAPTTEAPSSTADPEPDPTSELPPPSSELPPVEETTSVPPPEPVETTAPAAEPPTADQSAPEQSAPEPTPLTQSSEPGPTAATDTSATVE
jgi:hypothetical protein